MYNHSEIESKWNKAWETQKTFEPTIDHHKKKKMLTAAYPYPNSPQHIGHGRTYTTTDIYARYLRLKGYNVLFPLGFHVTGTPILAMAKRLEEQDEELLSVFEDIYEIPRAVSATLTEPVALVTHFSKEIEAGMKEMGYSVDWRRKYFTFDKHYNAYIDWQFRKLKEKGYLVQGTYPIAWCPKDNQAVSAHDTHGDVDPEIEEVVAVKFAFEDGFLATMTYRHETIYGVTNIWVNSKATYVKVKYKNEYLYLSKESAEQLRLQLGVSVEKEYPGTHFIGKKAKNLFANVDVPIYEAAYVDPNVGTGIVMSVPCHSLFDYVALCDIGKEPSAPPQVLATEGLDAVPTHQYAKKYAIKSQHDAKLTEANDELYKKEAHQGIMVTGAYKGMSSNKAKEKIKTDLLSSNMAIPLFVLTNAPVKCRCKTGVVVNMLNDQWFIDYGNREWKAKASECLAKMKTIPEDSRAELARMIEWLDKKPCARSKGLGTPLPFDKTKVIEALSDSTIYIALYTFYHEMVKHPVSELNEEFFDYVMLGKGEAKKPYWKTCRELLEYWYGEDSYHTGADLLRNHLPFHIFNHAGIFPEKYWPKQFVTNGFVLMDGKKMSKSFGNILPIRKAIKEFGADVIRFATVCGGELSSDTNFSREIAESTRARLEFFYDLVREASHDPSQSKKPSSVADHWLYSRMQKRIVRTQELYESFKMRELSLEVFYETYNDVQWYLSREKNPKLKEFLKSWVLLISPWMPYHAEEFYSMLGGQGFISQAAFPTVNETLVNPVAEAQEELVKSCRADIEKIKGIVKKDGSTPAKIIVFVANAWKKHLYDKVREVKSFDAVMAFAKSDATIKQHMDLAPKLIVQWCKRAYALPESLDAKKEFEGLSQAQEYFSQEFGCPVIIQHEHESADPKAQNAGPGKPAIKIE